METLDSGELDGILRDMAHLLVHWHTDNRLPERTVIEDGRCLLCHPDENC